MKTLLEDYKRKLKSIEEMISEIPKTSCNTDIYDALRERLNIKSGQYRSFIVDIERAIERAEEAARELPHFLTQDYDAIRTNCIEDTDVSKEWNNYLNKII